MCVYVDIWFLLSSTRIQTQGKLGGTLFCNLLPCVWKWKKKGKDRHAIPNWKRKRKIATQGPLRFAFIFLLFLFLLIWNRMPIFSFASLIFVFCFLFSFVARLIRKCQKKQKATKISEAAKRVFLLLFFLFLVFFYLLLFLTFSNVRIRDPDHVGESKREKGEGKRPTKRNKKTREQTKGEKWNENCKSKINFPFFFLFARFANFRLSFCLFSRSFSFSFN